MATIPASHQDSTPGGERSWRIRSGIARTFGSLFLAICVLLFLIGGELFYDAFAHPLSADSGQILVGSVCLACSLLLVAFLLQDRR